VPIVIVVCIEGGELLELELGFGFVVDVVVSWSSAVKVMKGEYETESLRVWVVKVVAVAPMSFMKRAVDV